MGTHPIFESDFDCLTESMSNLLEVAAKNPFNKPVIADAAPSCEFGSTEYYAKCMVGGALSCGLTHTAVVPLDLVKCRMQVDAAKYPSLGKGLKVTVAEGGVRALARGWAPTLIGYSMQGTAKFGFYEIFKNFYGNAMGEENAYLYRTSLYLIASASAEFFADIALCPMEAVKPRAECSKGEQLTVTFAAGYIAGVFCAIVSHPADSVVSVINKNPGRGAGEILREMGPKGVWKGLGARIIMIGTLTALQWFIYDGVKVALRLPRPPPPTMPESLRKKLEAQN